MIWCVEGLRIGLDELRHSFERDTESLWVLGDLDGEPAGTGVGRPSSLAGADYAAVRVLPDLARSRCGQRCCSTIAEHARAAGPLSCGAASGPTTRRRCPRRASWLPRGRSRARRSARREQGACRGSGRPLGDHARHLRGATRPDTRRLRRRQRGLARRPRSRHPRANDVRGLGRENLEGPGAFPEGCVIALEGDEVVGYTALRRYGAGSPQAENRLTAVGDRGAVAGSRPRSSGPRSSPRAQPGSRRSRPRTTS